MVPMHPMQLHPTAEEVLGYSVAVDGQVHGLPHFFLHKGHTGVELVRAGKVQPAKLPLVLDGRLRADEHLHAAAGVPMPPGVLLPLTVGATEAHTLPATPTRPLRASYHTSLPSVGTLHTRRRLLQTSASSRSLAAVTARKGKKDPQLARPEPKHTRSLSSAATRIPCSSLPGQPPPGAARRSCP